ncbi:hypothetical protein [Methylosarcina fibrata]|uniref:hypothetical protein n=1 Tax=Methylosarcina fibrata TaxID=105972 RepID=UPI000381B481|nr:hypothetical protein [Methylosarcina fibrata]
MKKGQFGDWLRESLLFIARGPLVWVGYTLATGVILLVGRISLALGIFFSVTSLFVGVGIAKYIDLNYSGDNPVPLAWAIRKSLPLAVLAAASLVVCWFGINVVANLVSGDLLKTGRFFFYWELTPENLHRRPMREIASWFYTYANVALVFVLVMLSTFASWFSYPLMLFRNYSFSQARERGVHEISRNRGAFYKLYGFIVLEALLCSSVTPLLTPVLYMLVSTLMYVTYQDLLGVKDG